MKKAELIGLGIIIGVVVGSILTWLILRQLSKTAGTLAKTASKVAKTMENIESWEMWEDPETGRLHAEIHRKVKRVE